MAQSSFNQGANMIGGGKGGFQGPNPGGPYTPRSDLGPDVGFGPGLPQQEPTQGNLGDLFRLPGQMVQGIGDGLQNTGQPGLDLIGRMTSGIGQGLDQMGEQQGGRTPGGKGGFAGPAVQPAPMGGIRGRDLSGSPNTGQLMGGMGNYAIQPPAQQPQNRFMPRGMVPPAGAFRQPQQPIARPGTNPRQLNVRRFF